MPCFCFSYRVFAFWFCKMSCFFNFYPLYQFCNVYAHKYLIFLLHGNLKYFKTWCLTSAGYAFMSEKKIHSPAEFVTFRHQLWNEDSVLLIDEGRLKILLLWNSHLLYMCVIRITGDSVLCFMCWFVIFTVDLLSLLQWKEHPEMIQEALNRVLRLNGEELVKFLQDVLDALFSMFSTEDGNSTSHSGLVFHVLVSYTMLEAPVFVTRMIKVV